MKKRLNKQYYKIIDWAGNRIFPNETFESFDEGWEYIYNNVDNSKYDETQNEDDDEFQEYLVMPLN